MNQARPATSLFRRCSACQTLYSYDVSHACAASALAQSAAVSSRPQNTASAATANERPDGFHDLRGTILGERYEILDRLGRGGRGVVYKARHIATEEIFVIKVLRRPLPDAAQQRFFIECELAISLKHPNVVNIAEVGVLPDGRSYLITEFLDGPPLSQVLQAGPVEPVRACKIALQTARALDAIHALGIVHRDLKPDNIFVLKEENRKERIKIVDFGLIEDQEISNVDPMAITDEIPIPVQDIDPEESGRLTIPGASLTKPLYMSPEQVRGEPSDARTDQYALGCIFYEMLTGKVLFEAVTADELLQKHISTPPLAIRRRAPGVGISSRLDSLVLKLLEKQPARRYAALRDFEQLLHKEMDLLLLQRGKRISGSSGYPVISNARPEAFWRRLIAGLLALLVAFLLIGGGIALWRFAHSRGTPTLTPK